MPKPEKELKPHNLILENRRLLKATGVADVEGFDGTKVYAMLGDVAFTVGGKDLKVAAFSAESGNLTVEGEITSVTYQNALSRHAGIFARIFK